MSFNHPQLLEDKYMYVVTFYSFKGGVGRTLALANVGLELARTGRRVLLVDFDLEAPGVHTFKLMKPRDAHLGLVDYISDYISSRSAPDVRNYIYEALGVGQNDGRLWVMSAGKSGAEYSRKLRAIHWETLYKKQDGFIMFEDMKKQWESSYEPDYVLIDSRTGHTDTGGICTRQLPNAVVTLFFPNEQNLAGLKPIVSSIRDEDKKSKKETHLHFVMSNVPDLDDEDEILANLETRFKEELCYKSLTVTIHRYDSLSLLQQSLFVAQRPKSRLAREYKKLMQEITEQNIQDREGVIQRLSRKRAYFNEEIVENEENRINEIAKYHAKDGELLYLLARDLKHLGRSKKSEMLLSLSIDCGYRSPEALLSKAETLQKDGNNEGALDCVWEVFSSEELNREQIGLGVDILRRIQPTKLLEIAETVAFKSLSVNKCMWISSELSWCKQGLQAKVDLLLRYYKDPSQSVSVVERVKDDLILAFIGLGKFEDAINLFGRGRPKPEDLGIIDCFNYAMAEWGFKGTPPQDMFGYVVELDHKNKGFSLANYHQCLTIALWVMEKRKEALTHLLKAIDIISKEPSDDFSCWRYLTVTPEQFRDDCDLIEQLIEGKDVKPLFWSE